MADKDQTEMIGLVKEAVVLIPKAFPTAVYLDRGNGFVEIEFISNDLQGMSVECPGDVFDKLNLADPDKTYDIEIVIREN